MNEFWTKFVRAWSSPDSCAGRVGVAVRLTEGDAQALYRAWVEMNGFNNRFVGPSDPPERGWWPNEAPLQLRQAFNKLAKTVLKDDAQALSVMTGRLADGSIPYYTEVPDALRKAFRDLATSSDTSGICPSITGPVMSANCSLGSEWSHFFWFLQRLGVEVRELPAKDSGRLNTIPEAQQHQMLEIVYSPGAVISVEHEALPKVK